MTLAETVRRFFSEKAPEARRVVVALSGGLDSTALLLALLESESFDVTAAHVNHHLRGTDSDSDQAFVEELCKRFGVKLHVRHVALQHDELKRVGVEAAARDARYEALREVLREVDGDVIATAHHRDDQAETVLMRLISGGGPMRLRGVRPRSEDVVRPFLGVSRDDLTAYVSARGIVPRYDAMNRDRRFMRTRVREELLPIARSINPRVDAALAESALQAGELDADLESLTHLLLGGELTRSNEMTSFDIAPLIGYPFLFRHFLHREIHRLDDRARDIDAADLRRISESDQSRESLTRALEVVRAGTTWTLRLIDDDAESIAFAIPIEPGARVSVTAERSVALHSDDTTVLERARNAKIQLFEVASTAPHRFEVRSRRSGDRFHPLGAPSEKSLKDFLIDRKINRDQRENLPLLTCNDEIVWVAGVEVSEKFKVRGTASLRFRVELIDDEAGRH